MSISNSSSKSNITSYTAVVWTLVTWISIRWPSEWFDGESIVFSKKGVFLFDSEPWLLIFLFVEDGGGESSEIGVCRHKVLVSGIFPSVGFSQNKNVVSSQEWIWVEGNWLHDDLRVLSGGLVA